MTEVIMAIISTLLGGGLVTICTMRWKVKSEKEKASEQAANTDKIEMDNFRTGTQILMDQIVVPLKNEMNDQRKEMSKLKVEYEETRLEMMKVKQTQKELTKEVTFLRRAIERISDCPHSKECPVKNFLKAVETVEPKK